MIYNIYKGDNELAASVVVKKPITELKLTTPDATLLTGYDYDVMNNDYTLLKIHSAEPLTSFTAQGV